MAAGESKEAALDVVLDQIVKRLIDRIKGASVANCYFALDPDDITSNPGSHIYVVSPASGDFREGAFVGAGISGLATNTGCIVKIHCPSFVDQKKRDAQAIMSESLSVLRKASAVISALSPSTAANPPAAGWVPLLGSFALTSPFRPIGYSLHRSENKAVRSIELTFGFEFDWDTTQQ